MPKKTLDDLFLSKDDISDAVLSAVQTVMNDYGFIIRRSLMTDISPDKKVATAMNSINAAMRNRKEVEYEAEAKKIRMIAEAERNRKARGCKAKDPPTSARPSPRG